MFDPLPGGVVRQRVNDDQRGDCFSACVSMLTGIPLGLLPILPPVFATATYNDGDGQYLHILNDAPNHNQEWVELLADNGFNLKHYWDKPEGPHITAVFAPGSPAHAIVDLGVGYVVDPRVGEVQKDDFWNEFAQISFWTITPIS